MNPKREQGIEKMREVYSFPVSDGPGDFYGYTLEHLFGEIWTRPGLTVRDRRMVIMGVIGALGQFDLLDVQFRSALEKGELTDDQVREIVITLAHYAGWPRGAGANMVAEKVIGEVAK